MIPSTPSERNRFLRIFATANLCCDSGYIRPQNGGGVRIRRWARRHREVPVIRSSCWGCSSLYAAAWAYRPVDVKDWALENALAPCSSSALSSATRRLPAEQRLLHADLRLPLPAHDRRALHLLAGALRRVDEERLRHAAQRDASAGSATTTTGSSTSLRAAARLPDPRVVPARRRRARVLGLLPAARPDDELQHALRADRVGRRRSCSAEIWAGVPRHAGRRVGRAQGHGAGDAGRADLRCASSR